MSCWNFQLLLSVKPTIMNWEALDVNTSLGWKGGGGFNSRGSFVARKMCLSDFELAFSSRSQEEEGGGGKSSGLFYSVYSKLSPLRDKYFKIRVKYLY